MAGAESNARRPAALRFKTTGVRKVIHRTATAAEVIGPLTPGLHVSGLTAGQFSAVDALEHMANEVGPGAEVRVSTWTTGIYDVQRAAELRANGNLGRVRMLLDRGTFEKSPQYAGPLIEALGVEAFRCLSVHAKVITVHGPRGAAVFRSSMNLNKNLRTEQFDLSTDPELVAFYASWFDSLWEEAGRSNNNEAIITAVYDRFRAGEVELAPVKRVERPAKAGGTVKAPWHRSAT